MSILEKLLTLVNLASEETDNIEKGAIGCSGYGFVFRDLDLPAAPFIFSSQSSKYGRFGAHRNVIKNWKAYTKKEIDLDELLNIDFEYDCQLIGSVKKLVPTLKFINDELLFHCWVLIKTPYKKTFPSTLYYGPTGLSLGGWHSYDNFKAFYKDIDKYFNTIPFELSRIELKGLTEAIELILRKIPPADFHGIHLHDCGKRLMLIKNGYSTVLNFPANMPNKYVKKWIPRL